MRRWNLAIDGACVSRHVEVASYLSKLEAVRTHVEVIFLTDLIAGTQSRHRIMKFIASPDRYRSLHSDLRYFTFNIGQ